MEQPDPLLDKDNSQLLGCLENGDVILAAGGGRYVLGAGPCGAEDVVDERELASWLITFPMEYIQF
jgi:hypothetical protein